MKTIRLTIDDDLLAQVNQAIKQQKTTVSALIKESLVHYLNRMKVKEMERQHREGYLKHPVEKDEFGIWESEQVWGDDGAR